LRDEQDAIQRIAHEILAEEAIKNEALQDHIRIQYDKSFHDENDANFSACRFYTCSHPGVVRENNEDSVLTARMQFLTSKNAYPFAMAAVADGMGGLALGEMASAQALTSMHTFMNARIAEYVRDQLPEPQDIAHHICLAIRNANEAIYQRALDLDERMGSTLTFFFLVGQHAFIANLGDGRGYRIVAKENRIEPITTDHSLVGRLLEMNQISKEEAKTHPRRHEIYRMLGLNENVSVDIEIRRVLKDEIYLLVSDGLWEPVDDADILKTIQSHTDMQKAIENLVDMANQRGGEDNASIVLIEFI
jgi:PPM family protein phosphatase